MNERTAQMQCGCCHPKEIEASHPAPALCTGTSASCWVQERRRALLLQNPCQQKAQCFLPGYWTEQTEQMPRRGWDHVAGIKGEHTQGWNERKRLSPDGRKLSSSLVICLHADQVTEGCVVLVLLLIGQHQHGGNMIRNQNISRTTHLLKDISLCPFQKVWSRDQTSILRKCCPLVNPCDGEMTFTFLKQKFL